jgi:sigma-B regulation protein RsbU (phosphoserine phosphatase)
VLRTGDLLVSFTDGVTEAESVNRVRFGVGRALDVVQTHRGKPAVEIIEALHRQIESFCRYQPYHDDVTVVIVKVEE